MYIISKIVLNSYYNEYQVPFFTFITTEKCCTRF